MKIIQYLLILSLGFNACKSSKDAAEDKSSDEIVNVEENKGNYISETSEINKESISQLSDSVFAQIQRTPCFGRCGIYTLTVFKSGLVRYKGEKWVEKEGVFEAKVDQQKLEELKNYGKKINYFELENVYDNESVTDLPATITSLRNEEGIKTIVNRYDGPKELSEFEAYFDALFNSIDWVEVEGDSK